MLPVLPTSGFLHLLWFVRHEDPFGLSCLSPSIVGSHAGANLEAGKLRRLLTAVER